MMSIDEARLKAGFFVGECLELFGISERTWYRWCQHGAPIWAYRLLHLRAGHLDQLGWKHWQIREGILYFDGFKSHGYQWEPGELLAYHWTRHNTRKARTEFAPAARADLAPDSASRINPGARPSGAAAHTCLAVLAGGGRDS
ncbi:hypothetical protein [Halopseudomonas formosensis]|nr:hypothetical protein [Halopseudomonas formosensis]